MASDSAKQNFLRDLVPSPSYEHDKALEKLGVSFPHAQFIDQIDSANGQLPEGQMRSATKLRTLLEDAEKHVLTQNSPIQVSSDSHIDSLMPSADARDSLKNHLTSLNQEYEEKLKRADDFLKEHGILSAEAAAGTRYEDTGAHLLEMRKEYAKAREDLINKTVYEPFLTQEAKANHIHYAPTVRDRVVAELQKDLPRTPMIETLVDKVAPMTGKFVVPIKEVAAKIVPAKLSSLQEMIDHVHEYTSTAHGGIEKKEKLIEYLTHEFEARGVKNFSLSKVDMTNLLHDYNKAVMDNGYSSEASFNILGNATREIRDFTRAVFKHAEHDGAKTMSLMGELGIEPSRIGVGVAGFAASSVGGYWVDRIRQRDSAEQHTLIADEAGNVKPAEKKNRVFEYVAATAVGVVGTVAMFDAFLDGPLSKAAAKFFRGGGRGV